MHAPAVDATTPNDAGPELSGTSVVIVSYRTGPVLFECLTSVLGQAGLDEVILVDNGNDGATRRQLEQWAARDARLMVLTGHGNVGFAAGCNLGARQARARHLLLLNPDCVLEPGTLLAARSVLRWHPDAWVVTGRLFNSDGTEQRGNRRNLPTPWTCLVESLRLDRLAPDHPYFTRINLHEAAAFTSVTPVQCISGAFMFMPREVWQRLDGMDEGYRLHVEDVDFCLRVHRAGGRILFAPDIAALHVRGTSRAFPLAAEWHKARGFIRYFRKHFRGSYSDLLLWGISAAVLARLALRSLPLTAVWLWESLTGRPSAIRRTQFGRLLPFAPPAVTAQHLGATVTRSRAATRDSA